MPRKKSEVPDLVVKKVRIDSLTLDPENARTHSPKNLNAIAASLTRFGQQKPIVVSKGGVVAAGNGTVMAARDVLEWDHILVVETELTGAELAAYGISDNRTSDLSGWDYGTLAKLIASIEDDGGDLTSLGWGRDELDLLKATEWKAPEIPDDSEAPQKEKEGSPIRCSKAVRARFDTCVRMLKSDAAENGHPEPSDGEVLSRLISFWEDDGSPRI